MENSSALLEFVARFVSAAFDPPLLQPAKASRIAAAMVNCQRFLRMFMADFSFPPLLSTVPMQSYKSLTPGDRPTESPDSCAQHRESPEDLRLPVCKHTR